MIKVELIERDSGFDFENTLKQFFDRMYLSKDSILSIDVGTRGENNKFYYAIIVYEDIITARAVYEMVQKAKHDAIAEHS